MVARGELEYRNIGRAKLYTLARRIPLESILSQAEDHMIITDDYGKVTQIGERTAALFGCSLEMMIGRPLGECSSCRFFSSDGTPLSAPEMKETGSGELQLFCGDQITFFQVKNIPVVLTDGSRGNACILTGITEQKRAEAALRESESKYRTLAEAALDPIFIIGRDDTVQYVNTHAAEMLNLSAGQIIGKPRKSLFPPDIADEQDRDLQLVFNTGKSLRKETRIVYGDHEFWQDNSLVPLKNETGNVTAVLGISRDITGRKLFENQLENSKKMLEIASVAGYIALWEWNIPSGSLEWSPIVDEMLGYGPGEFPRTIAAWEEIIHPDDRARVLGMLEVHLKAGAVYDTEYRVRKKSGEYIWWHDVAKVTVFRDGAPSEMAGACIDVTGRRRTEEALHESEEKFHAIFDAARDGILVADPETGRFVMANAAILEQTGYTEAELLCFSISDLARPADQPEAIEDFGRQVRREKTLSPDMPVLRKDGTVFIAEISSAPITLQGRQYLLGIFRDITERRRTEEALKESEDRYRTLVEISPDAVIVHRDGTIIYANPAALALVGALHPKEMIGKKILDLVHPGFRDAVALNIEKDIRGERSPPMEVRMLRADGATVIAEGRGVGIVFNGKPAVEVVIRDITERKQTEEQLHILSRERELLLREVHHRVRNTLQFELSEMAMERRRNPDRDVRAALLRVENRLAAVSFIFDRIYRSGNLTMVEFQQILRSIISRLSGTCAVDPDRIRFEIRAQDLTLGIDLAVPLAIIVNELVSNAIQHAFPESRGGTITIDAREEEGTISLVVSDDGTGLPEEMDPATSDSIGFTLICLLLQQVRGTMRQEPGEPGTVFRISVSRKAESDKSGVREE